MTHAQNAPDAQPGHLDTAQAAVLLGVSRQTVRRRGAELGRKVLGTWRIDPNRVAALTGGAR